jgi:hypothetical protein
MQDDLETVATFLQLHEAQLAVLRLNSAGFAATLADEGIVGANPFLANAVGGVKVQVPEEQGARARALLAEPAAGGEGPACMSCGAAMTEAETRCAACGWSYLEE